jgi:hypothetical protein
MATHTTAAGFVYPDVGDTGWGGGQGVNWELLTQRLLALSIVIFEGNIVIADGANVVCYIP